MSYARSQVLKFIRQVRPDDQVAIYLLTSTKLYMLHDLTNSSATLVRVMGGVKRDKTSSDPETVAADAENKRLNNALTDVAAESNRFYKGTIIDRVGVTSWSLGNIAVRLAKFPGRKNLVWVSSAFPIQTGFGTAETASIGGRGERHSYGGAISSIAQALSNADVAVYPVDARGLIPPDTLTVLQGACSGCPAPVQSSAPPDDRPFETMNSLAAGTGGRAFYNGNDLAAEIRSAIDDSRVTYVLGYYPGHNDWDGSFREIKVKVNRSGVQLRYRDGYFATAESSETADIQKHALTTALRSPVQILDLGLEVQINPIDAPGARQIRAQIHVLPGQMHFEQSGDRWTDGVEIAWSELSADGRVVGSGAHGLGIKPAKKGYDEIGQMGFTFSERVTVKNDAVEMRLVVRDTGSGAIGSVNIPLAGLFAPPPAKK
jgi:VWFA-related protein